MVSANNPEDSPHQDCDQCATLQKQVISLKKQLKDMEERAHHDVLTGLPNRRYFMEGLKHRILRCQRYGDVTALLSLDVNNLKKVNDSYGHPAGDLLLTRLAEILNNNVRASDMVARIGGDEFAILLDNLDSEQVELKINSLLNLIDKADIRNDNCSLKLGAAMGYCFIGTDDTVSDIMSRADEAMYKAKKLAPKS